MNLFSGEAENNKSKFWALLFFVFPLRGVKPETKKTTQCIYLEIIRCFIFCRMLMEKRYQQRLQSQKRNQIRKSDVSLPRVQLVSQQVYIS